MRRLMMAAIVLLMAQFAHVSGAGAQPALLFDLDSGQVLIANEAGRPWYPASLTKLMTAYLTFQAVKSGKLRLDQSVTISRNAARGGGRGAARYGARAGQKMTIDRMLTFLLVRSDADMAVALAEAVGGSEANFVRMMNRTARRLGMTGTHFTNPHGMPNPGQVTTARDMGMLAMAIYHHILKPDPAMWRYFTTTRVRQGKRRLKNRNKLLFMMKGANGMKTGFICKAGFNLVGTAARNGHVLAAVVFGRKTAYTRASFAKVLLEEGFRALAQGGARTGVWLPQIRNQGGRAPDISAGVCKGRTVHMAELDIPRGWAVALGGYRASVNAEATLEAELLAARLLRQPLPRGVVKLPEGGKFAGLVWALDQRMALALCARARAHDVACQAYPPMALTQLALAVKSRRAAAGKADLRASGGIVRRSNFSAARRRAN